jgi:hypothetical protein
MKGVRKTPKEKVQPYAMEDTSKEQLTTITGGYEPFGMVMEILCYSDR